MDKILCPSKGKHFCFSVGRVNFTLSNKSWFHETINSWRSPVTTSWHWCVLCHNFPRKLSPRLQLYSYNSNLFFCPSNLIMNWLRTTAETPFHRTLLWLCFVSFTFFVWSDAPELFLPQSFNGSLRRCFEQMGFHYSHCFACYFHIIIIPI